MKNLDARAVIELVLLVLALVLVALRRAGVLYIPGLAAILLAIAFCMMFVDFERESREVHERLAEDEEQREI